MPTILVVDDLLTDRLLVGGLLEKNSDWSVIYAADGREALLQVELNLPDLVLTDLQMPEMNGLELTQAVKREFPLIPIILMTAQGSEKIAVQALEKGASSYVPKRILAEDLASTVDQVLSAARAERDTTRVFNRMKKVEFSLENDVSLLVSLGRYMQEAVRTRGLCNEADRLRVGLALEEALLNAYYHGNLEVDSQLREGDGKAYYDLAKQRALEAPYWDRRIHVTAEFDDDHARFTIRDEGPGFDVNKLPDPTDPANLDRAWGRGVLLMRTFMDKVFYNETGNQVTLIKQRNADDVEPV